MTVARTPRTVRQSGMDRVYGFLKAKGETLTAVDVFPSGALRLYVTPPPVAPLEQGETEADREQWRSAGLP